MSPSKYVAWNEQDVPVVAAADLLASLSLWLARERQGCVLVTDAPLATIDVIEETVLELHEANPARGLSVLVRLRCLTEALASRRFRHLVRSADSAQLAALVSAAANLRLNAGWGMSPVRLAWAMLANATVEAELLAA